MTRTSSRAARSRHGPEPTRAARTASAPPAGFPSPRQLALVLVAIAGLAYANSLANPYAMDDRRSIVENATIRTLWPLSVPLSPPGETPVARRPLVNLSFAVNHAIGGLDVRGFRAGNLLIHLLAALALFGLVRRTLALGSLSPRFGSHANALAATCALLWALHPLHTEIVNYVSQRTQAMMGLCYLLTLYCSLRAVEGPVRWRWAAVVACAAGMACKESMVTAPILVVLFDRAFVFDSYQSAWRRRRALYAGLAAAWLPLALLWTAGARTTVGFDTGVSAWTYLLNQGPVLANYLKVTVWPTELVFDYGPARAVTLRDVVWPVTLIAVLLVAALAARWLWPRAGFLVLACFVLLAPTSSVVPIASEVGAERRMYLPASALVVLVVVLAYRAGGRLRAAAPEQLRGIRLWRWAAPAAVVATCALLVAVVVTRNREYASPLTLALSSLERWPQGRAYYAAGNALFDLGRREEALRHFRVAASDFPGAKFVLGTELIADGRLDEGILELREFVRRMPSAPDERAARYTIATALTLQRRYDQAAGELRALVARDPDSPRANVQLGEVLLLRGARSPEALRYLRRGAALQPFDARVHDLLGNALAMQGRYEEARSAFETSLRLQPTYAPARANLAKLERLMEDANR